MGDERISRACPDCGQEIGRATYCGCGWGKKRPEKHTGYVEPDRVKCAYDICFRTAKLKVMTPTGWANFCMEHYENHFKKQARETCENLGLVTLAQKKKYVKEKLAGIFRIREPGEDEEAA